jgi:hypothetical protein
MQTSAIFVGSTTPWSLLATRHVIIEASFPPTSCRPANPPIVRSMTTAFGTSWTVSAERRLDPNDRPFPRTERRRRKAAAAGAASPPLRSSGHLTHHPTGWSRSTFPLGVLGMFRPVSELRAIAVETLANVPTIDHARRDAILHRDGGGVSDGMSIGKALSGDAGRGHGFMLR